MDTILTQQIGGVHRTADLGLSMDTFPTGFTKLRTLAVLWTLFGGLSQNCGPQQFYGHFSDPIEKCPENCGPWQFFGQINNGANRTADHGSYMDTFLY